MNGGSEIEKLKVCTCNVKTAIETVFNIFQKLLQRRMLELPGCLQERRASL